MEIRKLDATALSKLYREKKLSPVEVAKDTLKRLAIVQQKLNPVAYLDEEQVLREAKASEIRWQKSEPLSEYDGVFASIKDNIAVKNMPSRQGSLVAVETPLDYDAPAVARLKEAGCIILCKTTMPEFGWKGTSDSPRYGLTRNPYDETRNAGGSSAGAAVLAALNIGLFHIGTDGAGSVRIPASFCGVFGLKPSYGRVPAYPRSVMSDLAHLGPLCSNLEDAAILTQIIGQPDAKDPSAWHKSGSDLLNPLKSGIKGMKIGFSPRLKYVTKIAASVEVATLEAASKLASLGAIVEEAEPDFEDPQGILDTLWMAGAALAMRAYSPEQRLKMDQGFVEIAEKGMKYTGADMLQALLRDRVSLCFKMQKFHEKYDLLLTPQMNIPALRVGHNTPENGFEGVEDWGNSWLEWSRFTYPFNITQQPAISIPCGQDAHGLPLAIQLVGRYGQDELVLRAAYAYEQIYKIPKSNFFN